MNTKNFVWMVPVLIALVGCGQSGELYLPDNLKAEQLEQQANQASTEARAGQLRSEASLLRQRHQQEQELRAQLAQQEASEQTLRAAGKTEAADEALKQVNRIRYDLGQLILQQQTK
jgi:predicted small lipoprotein YifL